MSTLEALHSVHLQDASRHTSQYPSDQNSNLSIARWQPSMTYQAPTYSAPLQKPIAPLALPSHDAVGSRAQSKLATASYRYLWT